jgi:mercuric ion transport protein
VGGIAAAFLAALCCVGPLLFVAFGVGAGLAGTFEPLRPLFGGVMVAAFALGFYTVYGSKSTRPAVAAGTCAAPLSRTRDRLILWVALLVALVLWTFPTWSVWLV